MQTNNHTPTAPFEQAFVLDKTSAKMPISQVFIEQKAFYLNEFYLFTAHFNAIPHFIEEIGIDCKKANPWFLENYKNDIKDFYYNKRYFKASKKAEMDDIFYFLYDDLLVKFDTNCAKVNFLFKKTMPEKVEALIKNLKKFKKRKEKQKPEIALLINSPRGIQTKSLQITKPKLRIEDNYNEDFKEVHHNIFKRLSKKNDKGIVLLHGKPGTGKTSYIRYLIASLKKEVIFLPPDMTAAITDPSLISILIENPNSVFVIEDAENIVVDREKDGRSPVSALLNISDGLLADCLNVQIICSFNTDISKIDRALMRKGRLIAKYEFKELAIEKAQELSDKLGFDTIITQPMTLTAIYNQKDINYQQSTKVHPIGFY